MKHLVVLIAILTVALEARAPPSGYTHPEIPKKPGYCDRAAHNKTLEINAFRSDVYMNLSDVALVFHLGHHSCHDCQGCRGEKYYGIDGNLIVARQPCQGEFNVTYYKDPKDWTKYTKKVHLDASHNDVKIEFSAGKLAGIDCVNCQGCQGSFGVRDIKYRDPAGAEITKKQLWAKSPCQGRIKIDYLKAHCKKISLDGYKHNMIHAKHISKPCVNGNIFRLELLSGTARGECEFGRDIYFHKDLVFYGNCTAEFEVCEVAPYEKIDHSVHVKSDQEKAREIYRRIKAQEMFENSQKRHHHPH